MTRAYCWRVGGVYELKDGKCLECGSTDHKPYEADNCGGFSQISKTEGTYCLLPIGHIGNHEHDLEKLAAEIHDS